MDRAKRRKSQELKVNNFVRYIFKENPKIMTVNITVTTKRSNWRKSKRGIRCDGLFFRRQEFKEELKNGN